MSVFDTPLALTMLNKQQNFWTNYLLPSQTQDLLQRHLLQRHFYCEKWLLTKAALMIYYFLKYYVCKAKSAFPAHLDVMGTMKYH